MCTTPEPAGTSASPPDSDAILDGAAQLGGYFAMPRISRSDDQRWRVYQQLLAPDVVARFVSDTRNAIADSTNTGPTDIPIRLAASSFQLGIAARLISPIIAAVLCGGAVPLLNSENLFWRPVKHSPAFGASGISCTATPNAVSAASVIADTVLPDLFGPLNDALRFTVSLSHKVTWGNVISAANGAVTVLAMTRHELEAPGRDLIAALLRTRLLAGAGHFSTGKFVRESCCLFYRAPGAGLCVDCVLTG